MFDAMYNNVIKQSTFRLWFGRCLYIYQEQRHDKMGTEVGERMKGEKMRLMSFMDSPPDHHRVEAILYDSFVFTSVLT